MITATTKSFLWLAFTIVPLFALWARASFFALAGYEGTCGLLDRSWPCSKWEYVKAYLFNAFVAPFSIAESVGWLLVVGVVAVMLFLFRKRDRVQPV
jgi:hypothetical protein